MLYVLRKNAERALFDGMISGIWKTAPVEYKPSDLTIVSQTCHRDVAMYLLAVKTFYRKIGHGRIAVVNDGSLTDEDKTNLMHHLVDPVILSVRDVDVSRLMKGGCWERLAHSVDMSRSSYVIQLDSDTLTTGDVEEVLQAVAANRPFVLGTWNGQKTVSADEASTYAHTFGPEAYSHIQSVCERGLARLKHSDKLRYVRGSAGFYGFSVGGISRSTVERFCGEMLEIVGTRFHEWGSEQFAVNFLVANAAKALVLPYPRYAVFGPELDSRRTSFFHFIGAYRFSRGEYMRRGRACVRTLRERAH